MTTQTENQVTSAQLGTRCALIQIVSTDPYVYALDVSFGIDTCVWQPTSLPIARFLMDNYTIASTLGASTKEFIKDMHAQYQHNKTLTDQLQEARRTVIIAHEGFDKVSERLNDEAEERSWCEAFDTIIDEVNDSLEGPFQLTVRMKDYVVDVSLAVSSHVSVSTTVTARNEQQARELVSCDFNSYFDSSDIRQSMSDSEIDDWSVEEIDASEA